MDTLNEEIKNLGRLTPASELNTFDIGGYFMDSRKWKSKHSKEGRNRIKEECAIKVVKDRNRVGRNITKYKPVKRKEL